MISHILVIFVQIIQLEFIRFNTEHGDYVSVYDGENSAGLLLGRFEEDRLPGDIMSDNTALFVSYQSNASQVFDDGFGFEIRYTISEDESGKLCWTSGDLYTETTVEACARTHSHAHTHAHTHTPHKRTHTHARTHTYNT